MYQVQISIDLSNQFVSKSPTKIVSYKNYSIRKPEENQETVHSYVQIDQHYHVIHLIIQLTMLSKR